MRRFTIFFVAVTLLGGCMNVGRDPDKVYSASYVGDHGVVVLDEVVAGVPSEGSETGFLNIHVVLAGVINAKETSLPKGGDVRDIIWRLYPRISSAVVATLQQKSARTEDISILREEILKEANGVFAAEFAEWASSKDYDVHIVVMSLYFTNGGVGRVCTGRTWWGW